MYLQGIYCHHVAMEILLLWRLYCVLQEVMEYLDVDILVNTMTEAYKAFMVGYKIYLLIYQVNIFYHIPNGLIIFLFPC